MTVGERIKFRRESLGISQVSLADSINEKKQTLYKYENNIVTNIPIDKLLLIAKVLNVSPAYLMGWDVADDSLWATRFREQLSRELEGADDDDIVAAGGNPTHLRDVASGSCLLSFPDACSIADTLGLSLDEMVGISAKESAPVDESGLDMTIINLILSLPENKKAEAVNYLRYLAESAGK